VNEALDPSSLGDHGTRLAGCAGRLQLLCTHLAGSAVRSRVEIEDLVQEVYLRALADPSAWPTDDSALFRYLSTIARHVVIDVVRAARAAKRDGREEALDRSTWSRAGHTPPAATPGPRTRAAGSEASRKLAHAFLALSPEHRRVIGLRQFEGLSARETAARMGRGETAVHSLYRRALAVWESALQDPNER
jgi:RNA polymerase sigma-70 factor (ECF subfamily)